MSRLSIRIDFEPSGSSLGPGMVRLLEEVARLGSIRQAAGAMDMSYRKAWLLIQDMQKTFNGAVVATEIGGTSGGGAQLTELGTMLVKTYRRIEVRAAQAADGDMAALAARVQQDAAPRRAARRKLAAKSPQA